MDRRILHRRGKKTSAMKKRELLDLTRRDLEILISEVENPQPPNEKLKTAAKEYRFNLALLEAEKAWERCEDPSQMDKKSFIKGYVSALANDSKSDNFDSNIFCED